MDYNVRYNIDVKSKSATDGLYGLQNTSKQIIPKIISDFGLLNKSISKVNTALATFNKLSRSGGKKIKFTLDKGINAEIKKLQSDINKVKGVRIRSTTGKQSTPSSTTVLPANTGSSTRTSTSRNGMNRGARGFGNGARGLYGLSDVMYAAGFPFPNMLGAAALGMGAFSIAKNAAEYENIMTTVQSILKSTDKDFVTFDKRFADMSHNIRQVGVQTKFTTTEVAGAAKFLGMAGMSIEDINNSIKPIANLAIVGDAPLDRMADIVTNIQTAYGLNSSDMPQIADILTSVTTSSNTSILEMGEAMKFAAPMMSMAKVSFNEAAAAIGALGNAGLKGTVAGTALRAMMTRLLNPTTAGLKVLEKYKVSLYEIDKATGKVRMRSLFDIFSQLRNKDASVQDLKTIFDKIGGNAANNIFAELYKLPELIHNSIYSSGISETIAGKKQETIAGKWDRIRSQFTETGMGIFESYNPVIKNGMDNIIAMLQNPGTAKMFSDIAAGLLSIIQMLIQVTQWVTSNWSWIGPLFIGNMLTSRIFTMVTSLTSMGSAFLTASRGAGALGSAIGLGGGLSGAGAGLLAAIGGIPGIIAAAVSALAVLGIQIFKTKSSVLNFGLSVQKQIEELQPGLKKPSAGNADNIESYWQQMGFVDGVFVGLGDYHGAVKKTANLDATKDFTELQQSFNDITNLGQNEAIQKIEELRNAGKMLYRDHGMYTFNNKSGETFYSQLYNKRLTTLRPKDVNEENFKDLIAYSDGYNNQLKALQPINDLFLDLASKVVYGAPIGEFEAKNFINSATGLDIDSLNGLGDKRINERVQGSYAQLMKSGFDRKTIDLIYKALPETITKLIPPSQLYSNKDVRIDGGSEGLTVATEKDENGNFVTPSPVSSISVPKYSKQQPKQINISIDSLAKDIKVNLDNPASEEEFRNMLARTLTAIVRDSEISLASDF